MPDIKPMAGAGCLFNLHPFDNEAILSSLWPAYRRFEGQQISQYACLTLKDVYGQQRLRVELGIMPKDALLVER